MACRFERCLREAQGAEQGRMRTDDAVIPHERDAERGAAPAVLSERVLVCAPRLAHAQRITAPRAGVDNGLRESADAGEGVCHRAEDGGDALLAFLRVDGIAVGETLVGGPERVEAAERARDADGPVG